MWKDSLGSITIATSIRRHLPSLGVNRLVLFTVTTCINENARRYTIQDTTQDNCRLRTNVLPSEEGFNQAELYDNIPQKLLKHLKRQNLSPVPLLSAMREIQGNMDDVLSRNDLRNDKKAKRCLQLQNKYLALKKQLSSRTRLVEINSDVLELPSTQDFSTATVFSASLNPFNATPDLKQAAILQKPETESSSAPLPLNPYFLTPPPTPSQAPKRKEGRISFVNYLDDVDDAMADRREELAIRNFELNLTSIPRGKMIDFSSVVIYRRLTRRQRCRPEPKKYSRYQDEGLSTFLILIFSYFIHYT